MNRDRWKEDKVRSLEKAMMEKEREIQEGKKRQDIDRWGLRVLLAVVPSP